ncbi:MAG: threonylcarbamoyl-AMP synthase [Methanosphaera sp. rholeuAM270]|nr:MAG: threonylcarbamoyl-AMP synthase [Methanosphaera sp. rholeuAM270]
MNVLTYSSGYNWSNIIEKLAEGKLVVYPTDTIYGIAANINDIEAVKRVYQVKDRARTKAISVCFHDFEQLRKYAVLTPELISVIKKLLPGSYTVLLYKKDTINDIITADSSKIGVRIPDNNVSYELTRYFPITSTSANISNQKTPDNIPEIKEKLGDSIDCYIDAGKMTNNDASTIIDLTKSRPHLIRKGACDDRLLDDILKINL